MGDWIRCFHPAPRADSRLLCFPHAGGSASAHHALSAAVTDFTEPLVVQYPGRQERFGEPLAERAEELIDAVLAALPGSGDDTPTALFGHSMGAFLAFETARRLAAQGRPPTALFVSGRRAPSLPQRPARRKPVREMSDADVAEEIRQLSGTADDLLSSPDLLALILPAVRADFQIVEDYVYRSAPPLDCSVTVFTGDNDPGVTVEDARAWERETRAPFSCHVLSGGHFFLNDHVPYMVDIIAATLRNRGTETAVDRQRAFSTLNSDRNASAEPDSFGSAMRAKG